MEKPSDVVRKYFNPCQFEALAVNARDEYVVAPRGFGKSEGIDARALLRNVHEMPRSNGAILSPTYSKLLHNTLPAVFHALSRFGYHRDIHYVVGKKPPKKLNYAKPYIQPFDYTHVIAWYNGSIQHMLSFDRAMSANSMSLDYILGFEAKFLDFTKVKNEVIPANRGNANYFGKCPWHHGMMFSTDMPTLKSGMWILEKEKDMDEELINIIKNLVILISEHRGKPDSPWRKAHVRQLERDLAFFRSKATFYMEPDAFANIEILGEDFIRTMKRDLPPLIFQTAILNIRPRKVANGFYSALNEAIHTYEAPRSTALEDHAGYDIDKLGKGCKFDTDLELQEPLRIALDYNAAINNVVTGQRLGRDIKTVGHHYVKTPRKLPELIDDWCDYYAAFPSRNVIYYYDSTAVHVDAARERPFYQIVSEQLAKRGWQVTEIYVGSPMRHDKKHNAFDLAFKGDPEYLLPLFNKYNCEQLVSAMQQTGTKIGRNGFEKDKDMEKTPDTPENPDELKTHGTDAWDTLYIGCNFFEYLISSGGTGFDSIRTK